MWGLGVNRQNLKMIPNKRMPYDSCSYEDMPSESMPSLGYWEYDKNKQTKYKSNKLFNIFFLSTTIIGGIILSRRHDNTNMQNKEYKNNKHKNNKHKTVSRYSLLRPRKRKCFRRLNKRNAHLLIVLTFLSLYR